MGIKKQGTRKTQVNYNKYIKNLGCNSEYCKPFYDYTYLETLNKVENDIFY